VVESGLPGFWTDSFPAFCIHRHAWPLVSLRYLVGVVPDAEGVLFRPAIPSAQGPYHYATTTASVTWDGVAVWSGSYTPSTPGPWRLVVDLGAHDLGRNTSFTVMRTDTFSHDGAAKQGDGAAVVARGSSGHAVVIEAPHDAHTVSISFNVRLDKHNKN
jgi:hypothetical protein